jgi:MFS family permease
VRSPYRHGFTVNLLAASASGRSGEPYYLLNFVATFCFTLCFTVSLVYMITYLGISPLQLVLVGTVLEATCFLLQAPTDVVADRYSRRLSVLIGFVLIGFGFALSGALPFFAAILLHPPGRVPTGHVTTSITTCGDASSSHCLLRFNQAHESPQRGGGPASQANTGRKAMSETSTGIADTWSAEHLSIP